jgi:hypothetical protein
MKRAVSLALLLVSAASLRAEERSTRTKQVLSPVYTIDRKYRSEEGPWTTEKVRLEESSTRELLWITGIRTEMVGPDGATPTLPEFMCHVSLNFENVEKHRSDFGWGNQGIARILALSQGQLEARFPAGFGIPLFSDEGLTLTTKVLNHNRPDEHFQVRHLVTIEFVRDADRRSPMKALRNIVGHVLVPLQPSESSGMGAMHHHGHAEDGDDDEAGTAAPTMVAGILKNSSGRQFVGHWVVKPGREVRKKNVTETLQIPFDTTLHYAGVHMHPFAESLELRDLTTGKSLIKVFARPLAKGIGLEHVDSFSSEKGIPIYKDHQYQMVSVYNNTTSVDQDSMAVMFLFLLDPQFRKPGAAAPVRSAP